MESGSVIHDRVGITRMGHPTAPYLSLGSGPSRSIDLGDPCWPLLDGDSTGGPLQTLLGKAEAKARGTGKETLIMLVSKNAIGTGV